MNTTERGRDEGVTGAQGAKRSLGWLENVRTGKYLYWNNYRAGKAPEYRQGCAAIGISITEALL